MTYICQKCEDELDDDVDGVLVLKRGEDIASFCLDKTVCAEAGAEAAAYAARPGASVGRGTRKSKSESDEMGEPE